MHPKAECPSVHNFTSPDALTNHQFSSREQTTLESK
jgi:hypothetical protein